MDPSSDAEGKSPAVMSSGVFSKRPTSRADLDAAIGVVSEKAREFARLAPAKKAELLRECAGRLHSVAADWTRAACEAKGISFDQPIAGEEWLAGPVVTIRNARLLATSLEDIAKYGSPQTGLKIGERPDGRVEFGVFPTSAHDSALFAGFRASVLAEPHVTLEQVERGCARAGYYAHREPGGKTALILGAGNVSSIPAMDALALMFVSGCVCILKMNPVNEWAGPFIAAGLEPLVSRGYLRVVYGGAEEGAYLCDHPAFCRIHITGSDKTHDRIVWGPPGPEQGRRKRLGAAVCTKLVTSELGNVSPVVIVPAAYSPKQLDFMARNVASMVANNASFNCNAAKVIVTSGGWAQHGEFLKLLGTALDAIPQRLAYYPGAADRFRALLASRSERMLLAFGRPSPGSLPWTIVTGIDPASDDPLFRIEPFCSLVAETSLPEDDPVSFLRAATDFCNLRLWGTLNACLMVHPSHERDAAVAAALDRSILDLRYGTVAINHWPGLGYGLVSPPWGGHPSSRPHDIQSGYGWVHNTFMLGPIEKTVLRGPLVVSPKPPWFCDHRRSAAVARRLVDFEAAPRWRKIPGIAWNALFG